MLAALTSCLMAAPTAEGVPQMWLAVGWRWLAGLRQR